MTLSQQDKNTINDIIKNNKSFVYQNNNPKKEGLLTYERYEKYKTAKNYKDFLKLGGIRNDFYIDFKNNYFKLQPNINDILKLSDCSKNINIKIDDNINKNLINFVNMIDNNILNDILNNQLYFIECIKNKLKISNNIDNNNSSSDNDSESEQQINDNFFDLINNISDTNISDTNNSDNDDGSEDDKEKNISNGINISDYLSNKTDFINQNMITYIGNKRKLIDDIEKILKDLKKDIGKDKLVLCDLFSGSGVVSRMMYNHSSKLITNDLEGYSYCVCKCYLDKPNESDMKLIINHINNMNNISINGPFIKGIISENYSPEDTNNIKHGERCFYTRENALIIDTLRKYIDDNVEERIKIYCLAPLIVKASINNNTSGVQKGFYKNKNTGIGAWGGTDSNATGRIVNKITLDNIIWNPNDVSVECYNKDSNKIINDIDNIDICYLDPPYNQHPYSSNYHLLDTIYKNKIDLSKLSNVSGIPKDWKRSVYNKKESAINGLTELLHNVLDKSKYAILSYNNEGIIPVNKLEEILSIYKYYKKEIDYNTFRGSRNLQNRPKKVIEIMYIISKK